MAAAAPHPLRVGLMIRPQDRSIDELLELFGMADAAGFDHLWAFDHAISLPEPDRPVYEGWTLLAALARVTHRARIGLHVTGNLYRYPGILAKQAVTVDHLSGGRLEMGIGAAWKEEEFQMLGIPFPGTRERIDRLAESCAVLKALWTEERPTFEGRYYQLRSAIAEPKPLQRPHPPLWIGGHGPKRTLRVVAKYADVWSSNAPSMEVDIESMRLVDEHCAAIGRDPRTLRRCVQIRWAGRRGVGATGPGEDLRDDVERTCVEARRYWELGFTEIILMLNVEGASMRRVADALAGEVLPRVRGFS